jgi:hypothetical protein
MTQEQLHQIFADVCVHGRQIEGWSCETRGEGHILSDWKRGTAWERKSANDPWIESPSAHPPAA